MGSAESHAWRERRGASAGPAGRDVALPSDFAVAPNRRGDQLGMMQRSRGLVALLVLAAALTLAPACSWLEDNGTHLAYALEKGAKELARSPQNELVVHYEPLEGLTDDYVIEIVHADAPTEVDAFGNVTSGGGGYMTVTGARHGGTSYHERFVFTPKDLRIAKHAAPTEIVLRKVGTRIDVVELR